MSIRQVRADFNRDSIVVYQAYPPRIADPALKAGTFVAPFSFQRMTWIKPSFLWLMGRSNWGQKAGQERILAVRITRAGWETALSQAVLTAYEPTSHRSPATWDDDFQAARVHVQWDPERTFRGAQIDDGSIQVGLSRHIIEAFVSQWIIRLTDITQTARKIRSLRDRGRHREARRLLPPERVYPVPEALHRRLGIR